ncbi:MAG: hypothetical protein A3F84_11390 [Candidatus Handelsmanbacteria bacterium RIFCSPLOWO2_12_FULL_64_10]|uniref:Gas vesicle protein GvpG n=1 Tax=Handelsmanbacteria sp. (strain RIFCSPLOWO2_12_FULL_64_10) TaxID=1817868 RepID=A0A1F6D781_HANXR|nr:MAG: hypothetical protein A3F84_11390 [Candidatus Handelsmanbacteria bacterium RIFCSPLOWO2_12_FULL_64_10]
MFLIDDILLSPFYGALWVFRQVAGAAHQELEAAEGAITAELSELYMMLETGRITEGEFNAREKELLDLLDEAQAQGPGPGGGGRSEGVGGDESEA